MFDPIKEIKAQVIMIDIKLKYFLCVMAVAHE